MASKEVYYEVEGAVFREEHGDDGVRMQVYSDRSASWSPYKGDWSRVRSQSNPMSLEEVKPYMGSAVE
jgi:hypothetical protein